MKLCTHCKWYFRVGEDWGICPAKVKGVKLQDTNSSDFEPHDLTLPFNQYYCAAGDTEESRGCEDWSEKGIELADKEEG